MDDGIGLPASVARRHALSDSRKAADSQLRISGKTEIRFYNGTLLESAGRYPAVRPVALFSTQKWNNVPSTAGFNVQKQETALANDDWRHGGAYLYVLSLSRAQRTWEFLRRNMTYRQQCQAAQVKPTESTADPPSSSEESRRWGLPCLERSKSDR
jgi:hypothetical protein